MGIVRVKLTRHIFKSGIFVEMLTSATFSSSVAVESSRDVLVGCDARLVSCESECGAVVVYSEQHSLEIVPAHN